MKNSKKVVAFCLVVGLCAFRLEGMFVGGDGGGSWSEDYSCAYQELYEEIKTYIKNSNVSRGVLPSDRLKIELGLVSGLASKAKRAAAWLNFPQSDGLKNFATITQWCIEGKALPRVQMFVSTLQETGCLEKAEEVAYGSKIQKNMFRELLKLQLIDSSID